MAHIKQNIKNNTNSEEGLYNFCYVNNQPQTLTMNKKPEQIAKFLLEIPIYVWIDPNIKQPSSLKDRFFKQIAQPLEYYKSVQQARVEVSRTKNSVVICSQDVVQQFIDEFQSQLKQRRITRSIYYKNGLNIHIKNILVKLFNIVDQLQIVFDIVKLGKYQDRKNKDFPNFISIQKQVWDSNVLVKTIYAIISQKTNRKQIFNQLGDLAKIIYPNQGDHIDQFKWLAEQKFSINKTIKSYTSQSFLYRILNNILRSSRDPTQIYILQPYFQDLFKSIKMLYKQQKKQRSFQCYRGGRISNQQIQFLGSQSGAIIQNLGFLSTTVNKDVADRFIANTFFEIEVQQTKRNQQLDFGYAFIDQYSQNQYQKQVLFNPLNTFKIISIDMDSDKNFYIIRLSYGELAQIMDEQIDNLPEYEKGLKIAGQYQIQLKDKSNHWSIGHVLVDSRHYLEGCLSFWTKYLQIARQSQDAIGVAYGLLQIGKSRLNRGQYKKALQYYQLSEKIQLINCRNQNLIINERHHCQILVDMGYAYFQLGYFYYALKIFQRCAEFQQRQQPKNYSYIVSLNNIGLIYCLLNQYNKSLKILEKASRYLKKHQNKNYILYATVLANKGLVYMKQSNYQEALRFMEEAAYIKRKIFGENHFHYCRMLNNIAQVYFLTEKYNNAMQYLQKCAYWFQNFYNVKNIQYSTVIYKIAFVQHVRGNYMQAVQFFKKHANITRELVGQYNFEYAKAIHSIGVCYSNYKYCDKGLEQYKKCYKLLKNLKIQKNENKNLLSQVIYEDRYKIFIRYQSIQAQIVEIDRMYEKNLLYLGYASFITKNYDEAQQYFSEYLKLNTVIDTQQRTKALTTLGVIYCQKGMIKQGMKSYYKSLKTYRQRGQLLNSAICHNNIGTIYKSIKKFQKALDHMQKSLGIIKSLVQKTDLQYTVIMDTINQIKQQMGYSKNTQYSNKIISLTPQQNIFQESDYIQDNLNNQYLKHLNTICFLELLQINTQ